jgi:hypothetical protein
MTFASINEHMRVSESRQRPGRKHQMLIIRRVSQYVPNHKEDIRRSTSILSRVLRLL